MQVQQQKYPMCWLCVGLPTDCASQSGAQQVRKVYVYLCPQVSFNNDHMLTSINIAPQAIAEAAGQASTGQQHATVRVIG
jgi:hypothetical protein